jgi:phosphoribosyl-AMP cyclohydrolase/phosphoribosyl-ATP pyrophosphohydrolase
MLKFDPLGLVPVVIQDEQSGQVLMVASMNAEALRLTRETGYTHLFSRSRNKLWRKGEESGHVQEVRGIYVNCEENSLLLQVIQHGPGACHTGHRGCYYRRLLDDDSYEEIEQAVFDPAQVYQHPEPVAVAISTPSSASQPVAAATSVPGVTPLSEQERAELETNMRKLFSAYIYLRDHDLSEESNTSRLLQEPSVEYLTGRLGDELQELGEVQTGAHFHTGRHDDTILEASQVGYWLMLLAAARNIKYDEVKPHEAILSGYAPSTEQTLEQTQECLNLLLSEDRAAIAQGLIMGFTTIGRTCAAAGVSPLAPAEYDMAQMRRKGLV